MKISMQTEKAEKSNLIVSGYVSVRTVLQAGRREVNAVLLDKDRRARAESSKLDVTEKRRYQALEKICAGRGIPINNIGSDEFAALGAGDGAGGFAAYIGERKLPSAAAAELSHPSAFSVIIDGVEDPYNLGYLIRSFYAAGAGNAVINAREMSFSDDMLIRSSAGAYELMDIYVSDDLAGYCDALRRAGVYLVSTAKSRGAKDLFSVRLRPPVCVIIGGERRGISRELLDRCDLSVKIKYARVCAYSLPSDAAGAVTAFEISKKLRLI